ncbi:MAG: hypothetical protein FJ125_13700, partial [Deltaproteobacteria bacterium]|nr:hypothetical protein [Deltaproteobacteria bacterium]
MRRFSSYGPVDEAINFCVPRRALVEQCVASLVGLPGEDGHFFTIWAARQTGKTWLMRRALAEIRSRYGDRFATGSISMQGVVLEQDSPPEAFLRWIPGLLSLGFHKEIEAPADWEGWTSLFLREKGIFDRPVILLIDEFDQLPRQVIDRLVGLFRNIYLNRESYLLHGLALVGVRAVLGVDSPRGSPFNVQRSLRVPTFSREEVAELFRQYLEESGQAVEAAVIDQVYEVVRGQPGLTCWLGELLTERFNPDPAQPLDLARWRHVHMRALYSERNNSILNLIIKARSPYAKEVQALFVDSGVPFSVRQPWCDYLELNGIITEKRQVDAAGQEMLVCQFASPFVQRCIYEAFTDQLRSALADVPPLEGTDALEDVFTPQRFDAAALLQRYKEHLQRLRVRGRDPFRDQPLRADFQLPEAVGHFHLYSWLAQAVGRECAITPEFPTGNGKVDLRILHKGQAVLVEVKSL